MWGWEVSGWVREGGRGGVIPGQSLFLHDLLPTGATKVGGTRINLRLSAGKRRSLCFSAGNGGLGSCVPTTPGVQRAVARSLEAGMATAGKGWGGGFSPEGAWRGSDSKEAGSRRETEPCQPRWWVRGAPRGSRPEVPRSPAGWALAACLGGSLGAARSPPPPGSALSA